MTPEKQNTNPEDDAAKKLEKEAQEKKQLEGLLGNENNETGGENLAGEEKIDRAKAVNLITEKIQEKSKNINDPTTQSQIDSLIKEMSAFNKPGILSPEEKAQLSEIYQEIEKLHGTEHAENAKAGEAAKKSSEASQKEYAQKLLDSTEKLRDFLKNNSDELKREKIHQETAEKLEKLKDELPDLNSDILIGEASPEKKA